MRWTQGVPFLLSLFVIAFNMFVYAAEENLTEQAYLEKVNGFIYTKENPTVMIGGYIYHVNDFVCGGKIINIFSDKIIIEFENTEKEYKVGDWIREGGKDKKPSYLVESYKIDSLSTSISSVEISLPKYSILKEEIDDRSQQTNIIQSMLIEDKINKERVRKLLFQLYSEIKSRKKIITCPSTNIYILVYLSKEYYESGMGQWIARLEKSKNDIFNIEFNLDQLYQLNAKQEIKFGLSEIKRKEIFKEIIKAEHLSDKNAWKVFKWVKKPNINDIKRQEQSFYEQFENNLVTKYSVSKKILKQIRLEGLDKDWAQPPPSL